MYFYRYKDNVGFQILFKFWAEKFYECWYGVSWVIVTINIIPIIQNPEQSVFLRSSNVLETTHIPSMDLYRRYNIWIYFIYEIMLTVWCPWCNQISSNVPQSIFIISWNFYITNFKFDLVRVCLDSHYFDLHFATYNNLNVIINDKYEVWNIHKQKRDIYLPAQT